MLYRNTKTGAIVNVDSVIHGDWERVEQPAPISVEAEEKEEAIKPKRVAKKRTK